MKLAESRTLFLLDILRDSSEGKTRKPFSEAFGSSAVAEGPILSKNAGAE
jgi:hypothetical protein